MLDTITQVARIELGIRPGDVREEAALIQSVYKVCDSDRDGMVHKDTVYGL